MVVGIAFMDMNHVTNDLHLLKWGYEHQASDGTCAQDPSPYKWDSLNLVTNE